MDGLQSVALHMEKARRTVTRTMSDQSNPQSPDSPSRIFGALAGVFAGFFVGIIMNIAVYTVSDGAASIGWANSTLGGIIIGAIIGCKFPTLAEIISDIIGMFLPL